MNAPMMRRYSLVTMHTKLKVTVKKGIMKLKVRLSDVQILFVLMAL